MRLGAAAGLALAFAGPALAGPPMTGVSAPVLQAHPMPVAAQLKAGETTLANGAVAYRPASLSAGPAPLLVLLHGASGYPLNFLQGMEPIADRLGLVLLYPHSVGQTWDFIINVSTDGDPWRGHDSARLDQSLADLFGRTDVDPRRVVLLGFSDGASYALSLGVANPRLFSAVVALSPGIFIPPDHSDRRQRVFVAHGRSDHILSFDSTSGTIVRELRDEGVDVRFRPFAGDHEIDPTVLREALDFALGLQAPAPPPTSSPK
jgi:predicted esterase